MRDGFNECLYIFRAPAVGAIKVGVSQKPASRLSGVKGRAPFGELYIDRVYMLREIDRATACEIEHAVHCALDENRINGEWFREQAHVHDTIEKVVRHECTSRDIHVAKVDEWERSWDTYKYTCDCEHHECWYPVSDLAHISGQCLSRCDTCGVIECDDHGEIDP